MDTLNFMPGPSQLYPTVAFHLQELLHSGVLSSSHRSPSFCEEILCCQHSVRTLLGVPESWSVLFVGSATEAMERVIQGLVENSCFHLVNGAFSHRFYQTALDYGKDATAMEWTAGKGATEATSWPEGLNPELIACTHSETSTGVFLTDSTLQHLRQSYPQALIVMDVVSSVPALAIPWHQVDGAFFSVQKGMGMPSGLGVLLLSPQALERAHHLKNKGALTGGFHSLTRLQAYAQKGQTVETPNMLAISLLHRICQDFLAKGKSRLERESEEKAQLLYSTLEQLPSFPLFVSQPTSRAPTVAVIQSGESTPWLLQKLREKGFLLGSGYGGYKGEQIRIANFPAQSLENFQRLFVALEECAHALS